MDNKITEYVLKQSKKMDKELKYDFMPSLLEIIERPAHKAGTVIIVGVFSLLVIAIIWACVSKLDVVITSSGSIQPVGNLNVVQSLASGSVKSINVYEGEYVEKDEILIDLDTSSTEIEENQLINQKKILEVQLDAYQRLRVGKDLSWIDTDEYDDEQKAALESIIDEDTSYRNILTGLENDKTNADLNHQIAELQLAEDKASGNRRKIQSQELVVQQCAITLQQADVKINDAKTQYSTQINSRLIQTSANLNEVEANLEKCRISKEYQQITAPVSGYVNSISINTIGESVTAAQELVTIVPDNTPVEMVCYVKNMDIGSVEQGMETEVKLEAYSYNRYGTVKGKVKYISPSSFVNEQMGNVYLVKIEITDAPESINVISGLSGSVEIKIGKRSVMNYFLDPIIKGFGESMKER